MTSNKIEGVIYPISNNIANNIFNNRKTVFVKYLSHEPTRKTKMRLESGNKLYIYVSGLNKSVVGEAKIINISYMDMENIIKIFKKKLMISESELRLYAQGRRLKRAQILELEFPLLYPKEIVVPIRMTMNGVYVTRKNKKNIFGTKIIMKELKRRNSKR